MLLRVTLCHVTTPCYAVAAQVVRILVNLFNLSVPIPFCLSASLRAHYVALLGFVTPALIIISVILFALGWVTFNP